MVKLSTSTDNSPYLLKGTNLIYNPKFGDDRVCECGHDYDRHFDLYEDEEYQSVGCKYCQCTFFREKK